MEPSKNNSKSTDELIWNQLAKLSRSQYDHDPYLKCLEIQQAWNGWIQCVTNQRNIRDQTLQKNSNINIRQKDQ